jgi:hypothetical protein
VVVDNEAGHAPGEADGEIRHHVTVAFTQDVQAPVQVDRREARMRRHVPQQPGKLIRCVRVCLCRQAFLGEAEPGELEQRVVSGDALLEQGMDRPLAGRARGVPLVSAQRVLLPSGDPWRSLGRDHMIPRRSTATVVPERQR